MTLLREHDPFSGHRDDGEEDATVEPAPSTPEPAKKPAEPRAKAEPRRASRRAKRKPTQAEVDAAARKLAGK